MEHYTAEYSWYGKCLQCSVKGKQMITKKQNVHYDHTYIYTYIHRKKGT